jgi:hypothetical protein
MQTVNTAMHQMKKPGLCGPGPVASNSGLPGYLPLVM